MAIPLPVRSTTVASPRCCGRGRRATARWWASATASRFMSSAHSGCARCRASTFSSAAAAAATSRMCDQGDDMSATLRDTVKVRFVQMNTALDESIYLPYSVALLQAYLQAHAPGAAVGNPPVPPLPPAQAVEAIANADIAGFSTYVWNGNRSLAIARGLKATRPETLIVFGGPHVPDDAEAFLRANPFIDVACHGEGEQTFSEIAERYPERGWEDVAGVSFIDGAGRFVTTPLRPRR